MTWFLSTKLGRGIALFVAGVAAVAVIYWRVFTAGRRSERTAQTEQSVKNYQTREAIHEDVSARPVDTRRSDLGRWVQPD